MIQHTSPPARPARGPADEVRLVTDVDPAELARAKAQRERADRNWAWLQAHHSEVYGDANRGRSVFVCGQAAFVADTPEEAISRAQAAHPDDDGGYLIYVPLRRGPHVHAR